MFELIGKGGPVMWPIIAGAFLGLAITVERLLYFYFTSVGYPVFRETLVQRLCAKNLDQLDIRVVPGGPTATVRIAKFDQLREIVWAERWKRSPYVRLVLVYMENLNRGARSREEALKRTGSEEVERMERHLRGLSAVAHISPLLGLLGTVTGIIGAFSVIASMGGQVDVSSLAGGIWEALITTVAGLSVAIPAQLACMYLDRLVSERMNGMSYTVTYLNERYYDSTGTCEGRCSEPDSVVFTAGPDTAVEEAV